MPRILLDTHSAIWYLENSPQLSAIVDAAIQSSITAGDPVLISSIIDKFALSGISTIW